MIWNLYDFLSPKEMETIIIELMNLLLDILEIDILDKKVKGEE